MTKELKDHITDIVRMIHRLPYLGYEVFELSDDDSMVDLNGSFEDIQRLLLECIPYTDRTEVEKRMPKYKEW